MSGGRFWSVWISFAVILLACAVAVTCIIQYYAETFDLLYGRGERRVVNVDGETADAKYYDIPFETSEQAAEHGMELTRRIAESGQVLLKNNGVLPLGEGAAVTPFGYHYLYPNYGPIGGSASIELSAVEHVSAEQALEEAFSVNEGAEEVMRNATPWGMTADGYYRHTEKSRRVDIVEFSPDIYESISASCAGTVGIVFIGRAGSEGNYSDITAKPLYDGTPHGAALSEYEKGAIAFSNTHCEATVVILNSCNPLDLSELMTEGGAYEADAILLIGGAGSAGFSAMASILSGEVSPSGRLADIYVSDSTKAPSYVNYGAECRYTNVREDASSQIYAVYLEYEEGIYSGYRYYETACAEDASFVYGSLTEEGAIAVPGAVTYPFGYGLSYTKFEQRIVDFDASGEEIALKIEVKNVGEVRGADVVQIYYTPPYTPFDAQNGVEKSEVVLAGFAKTDVLEPQQSETVSITFAKEEMASYCQARFNADGTQGCYMLEEGRYTISLRANSHDVIEKRTVNIAETVWYDAEEPRASEREAQAFALYGAEGEELAESGQSFTAATNRFGYMTRYMQEETQCLTRADWTGTQPTAAKTKAAPLWVVDMLEETRAFDPATDAMLGDVPGSLVYDETPVPSGEENGLTLADLRAEPYASPAWEELLDQLDYGAEDLMEMLHLGYMHTGGVAAVGKPASEERDGPIGLTATTNDSFSGAAGVRCYYCSPLLVAMSFDVQLAYEYGASVAWEAALFNGGKTLVSGWYAPGVNLHRGPFGGRYYEYLSEDPLLTGCIAAGIASGASDNGLTTYVKHFAANSQETARNGLMTWMTEQTLRELYLRPFEICIKRARSSIVYIDADTGMPARREINAVRGIMTAKNSLGAEFCAASASLLRGVLQEEWGFCGMVITDSLADKSSALYAKMFRAGVNVLLASRQQRYASGMESETARHIIRESVHAVCYAVVNSNLMQGVPPGAYVTYGISPWQKVLIAADAAVAALIIAVTVFGALKFRKRRPNPE